MKNATIIFFAISILCTWIGGAVDADTHHRNRIQRYSKNPWYWMHEGKPTLLIGGSDDDNLFQWSIEELNPQLDLLVSVGGNFLRNVLSTRDEGDVYPFLLFNGRYELSRWNEEFFVRLDRFLTETAKRDIIVQITLWDQHDFVGDNWHKHFWNPANNNIGLAASRVHDEHAFFAAVQDRNALILPYQMKYIERVLSSTLQHDHVLYNITNEGWAGLEWERFWAKFIEKQASRSGRKAEVTTMEHSPHLSVDAVVRHPSVFSYVELSQNNNASTGYLGHAHWQHIMDWRDEVESTVGPRPLMNEKIYGAEGQRHAFGSESDAIQRFWRNAFAGTACVRFHRPKVGLGLGSAAQKQIQALRLLDDNMSIPDSLPAPDLISPSSHRESYSLRSSSGDIAIYLSVGGNVVLNLESGEYQWCQLSFDDVRWNIGGRFSVTGEPQELSFGAGTPAVIWLEWIDPSSGDNRSR